MPTASQRGVLPRSFHVRNNVDYLYSQPDSVNAYLYDSALALIAVTGIHATSSYSDYGLEYEIVSGITMSLVSPSGDEDLYTPFCTLYSDPSGEIIMGTQSEAYKVHNETVAMVAYALGFYLEFTQNDINTCYLTKLLRGLLYYLTRQFYNYRNSYGTTITVGYVHNSLITGGIFEDDSVDNNLYASTNAIAYLAFRQGGRILGETYNYTNGPWNYYASRISQNWVSNFVVGNSIVPVVQLGSASVAYLGDANLNDYMWGALIAQTFNSDIGWIG